MASNTWSTRSPRRLDRRRSDRGAARSHLLSHGSATPPTRPSGALSGDRMYPAPASAGAAVSRAWPRPTAWVDRRAWLPIRRHQNEAEPVLEALDHLVVPIDDESDQVRPHGHNPTEARNASTPGADNGSLKRTRSSGASTSSLRSVSEGRGRPRHVERHGVRVMDALEGEVDRTRQQGVGDATHLQRPGGDPQSEQGSGSATVIPGPLIGCAAVRTRPARSSRNGSWR